MNIVNLILKQDKEKALAHNRHPWIFSGALEEIPNIDPGAIVDVYSKRGDFLARGYINPSSSIAVRVLSFEKIAVEELIVDKLKQAAKLRSKLLPEKTTCYRLINSEADGLPGLIVDCYGNVFVLQISTYGMEKMRETIIQSLVALFSPKAIYERSLSSARRQEGLDLFAGFVFGDPVEEVIVEEHGITFSVDIVGGQKTGFFLDHREMRKTIGELSKGKRVLNCFSYTAGFSLYALVHGASHVVSVDISEHALATAKKNTELNRIESCRHELVVSDVFTYLENISLDTFDIIIVDPPAFAKGRKDIESATSGYRSLNSLVFAKAKKDTLFLTSSCSHFIDKKAFQHIIFQASAQHGRDVRILQNHIQATDHPISLYHPEGEYLKSLLLYLS